MITHIKHPSERQQHSKEYEELLDIVYSELRLFKQIDPSGIDFYVKLESINKLCGYHHPLCFDVAFIMSYINKDPVVELMTRERLTDGIYTKINNIQDIRVYEGRDGNYYTAEKLNISDLELISMKPLRDYVEEQNICEGILKSWDSKTVKQKLIDFLQFYDDEIHIDNIKLDKSLITLNVRYIDFTSKAEDEIKQFANLIGYTYSLDEKSKLINLLPYHPESANKIVKENKNIVYHLTSKYFYDKIKHNRYIPLRSSVIFPSDNESKDRIYCFCGNLNDLKYHIESFKRSSARIQRHNKLSEYYDKNILLTIDTADLDIDWYYDPAYKMTGKGKAVFTKDFIETKNIINIQELKNGKLEI